MQREGDVFIPERTHASVPFTASPPFVMMAIGGEMYSLW